VDALWTVLEWQPFPKTTRNRASDFGQPDLTIEVNSAEAKQIRQKRLILTTGLHGIEGYAGSGILQLFTDEFLPCIDPETTGIILIHPINLYGMKHWTRFNKNNVGLNRNFSSNLESLSRSTCITNHCSIC
jgi:predicted deacylase